MRVVSYSDEYKTLWSDYVGRSADATIAHQIGWRTVIEKGLGHRPFYVMALEGSDVVGILPLFLVRTWWGSKYLVSLPWIDYGGICADNEATAKALLAEAQRLALREKAEFVEFRSVHDQHLGLSSRTDKVTFLLPLAPASETMWTGFDAKLRNQIRKSQKSELTTEFGGIEKLGEFYPVFARNMRDLGTPVWGQRFFAEILTEFPSSAQLILVRKNGQAIAGGLVLAFKDRLYVPSASSYRSALEYCPNHALYWAVIRHGCERGYRCLDFGRSTWEGATYKFKKQWGAPPTQLTWQYSVRQGAAMPAITPDNPKYRLFIRLWQRLPLPLANFLGPRVIRNFP